MKISKKICCVLAGGTVSSDNFIKLTSTNILGILSEPCLFGLCWKHKEPFVLIILNIRDIIISIHQRKKLKTSPESVHLQRVHRYKIFSLSIRVLHLLIQYYYEILCGYIGRLGQESHPNSLKFDHL